jgi:hypothetical protein
LLQSDETALEIRQYIYQFIWPDISTHGTVDVQHSCIAVHFPEKTLTTHKTTHTPMVPTRVLTINQHVLFNSEWLPIYNIADFYKCQAMLQRLYYEYLTFYACFPNHQFIGHFNPMFDEQRTMLKNATFSLECNEGYYHTSIDLHIKNNFPPMDMAHFLHVELYIGSSLIFSSKRDLNQIDDITFGHLLDFILQKITKL